MANLAPDRDAMARKQKRSFSRRSSHWQRSWRIDRDDRVEDADLWDSTEEKLSDSKKNQRFSTAWSDGLMMESFLVVLFCHALMMH